MADTAVLSRREQQPSTIKLHENRNNKMPETAQGINASEMNGRRNTNDAVIVRPQPPPTQFLQ